MENEIKKTQHYSNLYKELLKGIEIPNGTKYIEPFVGEGVLLNTVDTEWEMYDLEPKVENALERDTLLNPPDYNGKIVITNPPYLAKNKTKKFKEIYEKYDTDDLYKASLKSIIGCEAGILIIPANFFMDEECEKIRNEFLSKYIVKQCNIFYTKMFDNTTINVCCFNFYKCENEEQAPIINGRFFLLKKKYGYRIGGEWFNNFKDNIGFSRLREGNDKFITNIYVDTLDTRKTPLHFEIRDKPFVGKSTDRMKATIVSDFEMDLEKQKQLVHIINTEISKAREKYHNMIFSTYRDGGRKRIGFDFVYKILSYYWRMINE